MFENVIKHLESEIIMFNKFLDDKTGIITEVSKGNYRNDVKEFEQAISALKNNGVSAEPDR